MKKILLLFSLCLLSMFSFSQVPTPNPCGQSRCLNETVIYGESPIDPNATYTLSVSPATTSVLISSGTQLQVTFNNTGTYTITITKVIPGCPPVTSMCDVLVNPLVIPTITTVSVCEGSPAATMTSSVPGNFTGTGVTGDQFNAGTLVSGSYNVTFVANAGTCISTLPITGSNIITPGPTPPIIGSN